MYVVAGFRLCFRGKETSMSDTFHQTVVLEKFANWAYLLWGKWNTYPTSEGTSKATRRENQFRGYISALCDDVHIYKVKTNFCSLGSWGAFSRPTWLLQVENKYFAQDNIKLGDYVEVCKTAIHELRHAEQYYRIAQALYLGILEWPGDKLSKARKLQNVNDIGAKVRMKHEAVQHAADESNRYDNFAMSAPLSHCVIGRLPNRPNDKWTLTVDNWLDRRFRPDMKEWGDKGLSASGGVIDKQFYWRGELDTDTMALEAMLEKIVLSKWRNYSGLKNSGRQDPAFTT